MRMTDSFDFLTFTKVSCLHFGQYSGKLISSVSVLTLSRVLFLHIGQRSHIASFFKQYHPFKKEGNTKQICVPSAGKFNDKDSKRPQTKHCLWPA